MRIEALSISHKEAVHELVEKIRQRQGLRAEFYWTREMVEDELEQTDGLCAFKAGRLVGVILYRKLPEAWEISLVASDPKFRRQGLMETLLQQLINAMSHNGELWLEVHELNVAAQNLYEKLGFRKTGVRQRYYKDGGTALLYSYSEGMR